jgi:thioesterase domain-containing protein/acyl carrier protein
MALELESPLDLDALDLDVVRRAPTGDLGRLLPDGSLELLGRADHRVKVRGQMVDPGRVEATLVGLPEVRDAVVSAVTRDEATTLVAHLIPVEGAAPRARDLRRALAALLPSVMVPSTFVLVSELPRIANGKPDRIALVEMARTAAPESGSQSEARPGTETIVAGLFWEALGVDIVGRDDDFFDLGGDSLAAVELITALRESFGVPVGSAELLDGPTVADLSIWIDATRRTQAPSARSSKRRFPLKPVRDGGRRLVTLRSDGDRPPIYAVPGAGGSLFQLLPLAGALEDRALHQFVPKGMDARTWPNYTVESMARRNLEAMADVEVPIVLAGYSAGGFVAWEMAQRLAAEGRTPACLLLLDPSGFESKGSGFRARVRQAVRAEIEESGSVGGYRTSGPALPDLPSSDRVLLGSAIRHAREMGPARLAQAVRVRLRQAFRCVVPPATAGLIRRNEETEQKLFYDIGAVAARRYGPRMYAGTVVVVLSQRSAAWKSDDRAAVAALCGHRVETLLVDGDHRSFLRSPYVKNLGVALNRILPS